MYGSAGRYDIFESDLVVVGVVDGLMVGPRSDIILLRSIRREYHAETLRADRLWRRRRLDHRAIPRAYGAERVRLSCEATALRLSKSEL